jgi:hypothetical protein
MYKIKSSNKKIADLHNICQETSNRYANQHPDEHQRYVLKAQVKSRTDVSKNVNK